MKPPPEFGPRTKVLLCFLFNKFFLNFDLELQFDFMVRFGLILPLQFSHQVDKWRVLGAVLYFAFHSIRFFSNFDLESEFDFKISFSSPTK